MNAIFDDFKDAFSKRNNILAQLIVINIVLWVVHILAFVFANLLGTALPEQVVQFVFFIPSSIEEFIYRPWTVITYAFQHSLSIFHILFNMLWFYWFGKIIEEFLGSDRLLAIYVLGALAGAGLYLAAYNTIPFYIQSQGGAGMIGASAAVTAIAVAAATLAPDYRFNLIFLGPVKIVYIAGFMIIISILGSVGRNSGGNLAHLGGGLMGYIYIKQLQSGNDIGAWVIKTFYWFKELFKPASKLKVSYKNTAPSSASKTKKKTTSASSGTVKQEEIDAILDKISQSGYESLTKEEKQKLFSASQNKDQ
jgi:membrane associated rhomboid family serine protease